MSPMDALDRLIARVMSPDETFNTYYIAKLSLIADFNSSMCPADQAKYIFRGLPQILRSRLALTDQSSPAALKQNVDKLLVEDPSLLTSATTFQLNNLHITAPKTVSFVDDSTPETLPSRPSRRSEFDARRSSREPSRDRVRSPYRSPSNTGTRTRSNSPRSSSDLTNSENARRDADRTHNSPSRQNRSSTRDDYSRRDSSRRDSRSATQSRSPGRYENSRLTSASRSPGRHENPENRDFGRQPQSRGPPNRPRPNNFRSFGDRLQCQYCLKFGHDARKCWQVPKNV